MKQFIEKTISLKETLRIQDSRSLANVITSFANASTNPDELAQVIVDSVMDGISESEYGSDERFLLALRKNLKRYNI